MAAHTLTIIHQTLNRSQLTVMDCEQLEHACGYAKGMDIPALSTQDWELIYEAAKTRVPAMLKVALENVLPRVAYQEAYINVEHLSRARMIFVAYETDGWLERSSAWATMPMANHRMLAQLATEIERGLASR